MIYATFNAWSEAGFKVLKGAKAHKRNDDGVAVFSEMQVEEHHSDFDDAFMDAVDDGAIGTFG